MRETRKTVAVERRSASQTCALGAGRRAAVKELEGETHVLVCRVCCYGAEYSIISPSRCRELSLACAIVRSRGMPWERRRAQSAREWHTRASCERSCAEFHAIVHGSRQGIAEDDDEDATSGCCRATSSIVADRRSSRVNLNSARKTSCRISSFDVRRPDTLFRFNQNVSDEI